VTDWRRHLVTDDDGLARVLREARTVAVIGAKADPAAAAHYVPAYLAAHGYRIRPINPTILGQRVLGVPVIGRVADLEEPVDVIEVFRRPQYLPAHAAEIVALPWRPRAVWFQLGIRNDAAAAVLARAGIDVVQDRCMMPEHRRLVGARR
jgi:predicted CoA-binding protein